MNAPSQDDVRPGLRPPQFGLRTMLAFVAIVCALLAVSRLVEGYTMLVIVFFLLSIAAHVAGNAIGTRLRDNENRPGGRSTAANDAADAEVLTTAHFAPTTKLSRNQALGLTVIVCVGVGVVVGGAVGGWLLAWAVGEKATWANMSLGIGAFGVIGGFLGFLTSSFLKVLITANIEAWRAESQNGKSPRSTN